MSGNCHSARVTLPPLALGVVALYVVPVRSGGARVAEGTGLPLLPFGLGGAAVVPGRDADAAGEDE